MPTATIERPGPLARLSEEEIKELLVGFPDSAIASAICLRKDPDPESLGTFLIQLLGFYLSAGKEMPTEPPSEETCLRNDLGLDSLSMAEAMFKIEEVFDIRVESAEIAEISTVADARRILTEKLAEQSDDSIE